MMSKMIANNVNRTLVGTEKVLNLNLQPISGLTMDEYDFEITVWCFPKKTITIRKSEMMRVDSSNYEFIVDTEKTGSGTINVQVTAQIPDKRFDDGFRKEVVLIETDIRIHGRML